MNYSDSYQRISFHFFVMLCITASLFFLEVAVAKDEEVEEILVTSTRGKRSFADLPTRVEVLGGEEINEKTNMKPGDVRMLLNESTGIYVQQTSATSFN